jgi:nucleoside-diphosphate-sugar epimerase
VEIVFKEGRKQDVPANVLDISLARRELNWRPEIELPQGIRLMFSSWSASKHKFMI